MFGMELKMSGSSSSPEMCVIRAIRGTTNEGVQHTPH